MKPFLLSPEAELDLNDIWEFIASDSPDAADRWLEHLHNQILSLVEMPGLGHRREDLVEKRAILFWPVGNYLILYRRKEESIEVVAVVVSDHLKT